MTRSAAQSLDIRNNFTYHLCHQVHLCKITRQVPLIRNCLLSCHLTINRNISTTRFPTPFLLPQPCYPRARRRPPYDRDPSWPSRNFLGITDLLTTDELSPCSRRSSRRNQQHRRPPTENHSRMYSFYWVIPRILVNDGASCIYLSIYLPIYQPTYTYPSTQRTEHPPTFTAGRRIRNAHATEGKRLQALGAEYLEVRPSRPTMD